WREDMGRSGAGGGGNLLFFDTEGQGRESPSAGGLNPLAEKRGAWKREQGRKGRNEHLQRVEEATASCCRVDRGSFRINRLPFGLLLDLGEIREVQARPASEQSEGGAR